jgi:hypothetical protein
MAGVLAAAGLAISAAMIGSAGTARADVVPPPAGVWAEIFNPYLHAQNITLCADDPAGSTANGTWMQLWRCHGYASNGAPQRWEFSPYSVNGFTQRDPITGNQLYHIYNQAAGKCLGYAANSATDVFLALRSCPTADDSFNTWELMSDNAISQNGLDFQLGLYEPGGAVQFCAAASTFTDNNGTRLLLDFCDPYDTRNIWNLG